MKGQFRKLCTMKNANFKDMVFGVGALVFFGALLALTPKYGGDANAQALTSGATSKTYPYIIGGAGVIVALWLIVDKLIKLLRESRAAAAEAGPAPDEAQAPGRTRWGLVVLCVGALALMNVLLIRLGVVLGGILYLLVQIFLLTAKKDLTVKNVIIAVIVAAAVPLMIYFPFRYIFHAKLPMGIFR